MKEFLSDPVRVLNALSIFLLGMTLGLILGRWII
jgi:hypothetical protein